MNDNVIPMFFYLLNKFVYNCFYPHCSVPKLCQKRETGINLLCIRIITEKEDMVYMKTTLPK